MERNSLRIGITHGDTNGVGYEVILKTISDERLLELCTPVIYGSVNAMNVHRKLIPDLPTFSYKKIPNAVEVELGKINIVNCVPDDIPFTPGQPSREAGLAAFKALETAVDDLKSGRIDALLTAPIHKDTIQNDDFHFPGHTEYLEKHFAPEGSRALMILMDEDLRVALVTGHVPLSKVSSLLSKQCIVERIEDFDHSLRQDFRVVRPRIAVLALNPHGGEQGLLGSEEEVFITPAIKEVTQQGILAFGPFPADGFFGSRAYTHFDGVLAMYHDQGLIPFKSLSMKNGVNFTAGLSIVRTSPAHGTAYDIAGKGIASEDSFRQALYAAIDVFRYRLDFQMATANPLKNAHLEKERKRRAKPKAKDKDEME
jgi:4-hydroxythreonine-4-phosphate dehydrogenase